MRHVTIVLAMVTLLTAGLASAAEQPKRETIEGTIQSVDIDTRIVTVLDKKAETGKIALKADGQIFREETAQASDMKDQMAVQVDGKISQDGKTFTAKQAILYIPKGRGFQMFGDTRIDGTLHQRDGKWFVSAQDKEAEVELMDNCKFVTRTWVKIEDIPTGVYGSGYGVVTDDGIMAYIFRFQP